MRLTKEAKALAVLEWLEIGPQNMQQVVTMSGLKPHAVHQGIAWLRDYDPNCIVTYRQGPTTYYKLAEEADEVRSYVHGRAKTLFRMALRLERMVTIARVSWPEDGVLKVMAKQLTRLREDVDELEDRSA